MTEKIIPTPGRIVHYFPHAGDGLSQFGKGTADAQPLAAIVTGVHADNMVNLCVFDTYGNPHARPNVFLVQPGNDVPTHAYCAWMAYQVKAAGIELPVVEAPAPASDTPSAESTEVTTETTDEQQANEEQVAAGTEANESSAQESSAQ